MEISIDLENLMKNVATSTIGSLLIPPMTFDSELATAEYYRKNLDSILAEFNECFKTDLQAHIAKQIADA